MLVHGDERRTWAEEFDVACRVAQAARRDGLGVGDRIAFLDRNGIAYFDFLFGGSLIGAVNVAVNWRLSPAEMAAIIDDSGAPPARHPHGLPRRPSPTCRAVCPRSGASWSSATARTGAPIRGP